MMKQHQSISIAMCTYNGGKYLQEQLDSIASQTRLPDELVICDDCSNDNTVDIINGFSQEVSFPMRVYINEYNLGITKNFEKAISLCQGNVIALSDQDDVWHPDKLKEIDNYFSLHPKTGALFTDAVVVDEKLKEMSPSLWKTIKFSEKLQRKVLRGKAYELLVRGNFVTGATMAFREKYKKDIMPIPTNLFLQTWVHDGWIALVISAFAEISFINKPLIKYRQHSMNQVGLKGVATKKNFHEKFQSLFKEDHNNNLKLKKEILNHEELLNHLLKIDCISSRRVSLLKQRVDHLHMRVNLPKRRLGRIFNIVKDLLALKYHRFSGGFRTAIKDLILA